MKKIDPFVIGIIVFTLLIVCIVGIFALKSKSVETKSTPVESLGELSNNLLSLINELRTSSGKKPLMIHSLLEVRAQARADYLCTLGNKTDMVEIFTDPYFRFVGENPIKGVLDSSTIHKSFLSNTETLKYMVDDHFQYLGIGRACDVTIELFGGN